MRFLRPAQAEAGRARPGDRRWTKTHPCQGTVGYRRRTGHPPGTMPPMRWGRPKSLSGLMLTGLVLIAVPLLAAILTAVLQMRDLATTGQKIIVEGVTAARASQALFAQIASLERTARLYHVLNDPKLLDVYRSQDSGLTVSAAAARRARDRGRAPDAERPRRAAGEYPRDRL